MTVPALVRAAHPLPTVAVTGISVLLAAVAGNSPGECALLAAAVLAGQLTVGWSNDLLDAAADAEVGRISKPLAAGELSSRLAGRCLAVAVPATVLLSLAAGWRPGLVYLFGVGCGWLYNLWLKGSWLSWLPYAVAFAALPVMATLALSPPRWPAGWAIGAAALIGVAANLTNTLPELATRHPARFRGMPDRIGPRPSLLLAGGLMVLAVCWLAIGAAGMPGWLRWAGPAAELLLAGLGIGLLWRRAESRAPFYAMVGGLVVPAAMVIAAGHALA
ncbi:MAG TPA: UbiA family prenyltransferase [Jatrophihabitans sp.]|nr:UbiA family prenyltransferase [Jatrophihabitans sp.]